MRKRIQSQSNWKPQRGVTKVVASFVFLVGLVLASFSTAKAAITNSATASGTYQAAPITSNTAAASVPVAAAVAQIGLVKTAGPIVDANANGKLDAGDTITYSLVVSNIGNVTLTNIAVSDPKLGPVTCAKTTLIPTEQTTCTAPTYVIAQADINAGLVSNSASVTSNSPAGGVVIDTSDPLVAGPANNAPTVVTLQNTPVIGLVKKVTPPVGLSKAGDTLAYTFEVSNLGNVPFNPVTVVDTKVQNIVCPAGALNPGQKITCTGNPYVITQTDMDAGSINNTAVASGVAPDSKTYSDDSDPVTPGPSAKGPTVTPLTGNPQFSLVKTDKFTGPIAVGTPITYTFTVTNTGTVTIKTITLTDTGATLSGGPIASLAPGATDTLTFTASHALTAADLAQGSYQNSATATGTPAPPGSTPIIAAASVTTPLVYTASMTLTKSGVLASTSGLPPKAGDIVNYTFVVTNTGSSPLTNVTIADLLLAQNSAPSQTQVAALQRQAAGGDAEIATASIDGTARVSGAIGSAQRRMVPQLLPPLNTDLVVSRVLLRMDGYVGPMLAGDKIGFLYRLSNTGDVPLTSISVAQPDGETIGNTVSLLNPNETDAASIIFTRALTPEEATSGTVAANGYVTLKARGREMMVQVRDALPLSAVKPYDSLATASITPGTVPTLNPASSQTFTASYALTQVDIDAGTRHNSATATALDVAGKPVSSNTAVFDLPLQQAPSIGVVKTGTLALANGTSAAVGDIITYKFAVTNLGNVTLKNIAVGDGTLFISSTAPIDPLPPGITDSSYTATYAITQADLDAGHHDNQATLTATAPSGPLAPMLSDFADPTKHRPTVVPIAATPAIGLLKQVTSITDTNSNGRHDVGDVIHYQFTIKNTGNVQLTNVLVTDPMMPGAPTKPLDVVTGAAITLAPGATDTSFTGTYVIEQADMDLGHVNNTAKVVGTDPTGKQVQDFSDPGVFTQDGPTITLLPLSQIAVQKVFSHFEDAAGITVPLPVPNGFVVYTIKVQNTGNVNFADVLVAEVAPFNQPTTTVVGTHPFPLPSKATDPILYTDATHFIVKQKISNADILSGSVKNQVSAIGVDAAGVNSPADLSDPSDFNGNAVTVVPLTSQPSIAVIKTATVTDVNHNGANDTGDIINYSFQVVNTGNVDLTSVDITDANAAKVGGPIALLMAGATDTTTFTATHTVTAADLAAGSYPNQATATSTYSGVNTVSGDSDYASLTGPRRATVVQLSAAKPVLTKTAARSQVKRGEIVGYTITATNLGAGPFQLADIMPPGFGFVAGSAKVNGAVVTPVVNGQTLTFNSLTPNASKITLTLNLMASTTLSGGKFVNNARLIDPTTNQVMAVAQATVEVVPEAVFDCSDIIGRVFDDLNGNGYMDDGEPGLAGVRLVTLNGVLITTDAEGRYHVPCAAIPDAAIGANYVLKLDPRTLPHGYKLTTENPRDVRVTRGKATILNFGAAIQHDVKVDVTAKAFASEGTDLVPNWQSGIGRLCKILTKKRSALQIIYHQAGETGELAQARVDALVAEINATCNPGYPLKVKTSVEEGK